MTNRFQVYDSLSNNNTFPMPNFNKLRDIISTQWIQVPGPELAAYSPLFKKFMVITNNYELVQSYYPLELY